MQPDEHTKSNQPIREAQPSRALPIASPANMLPVQVVARDEVAPDTVSVLITLPGTRQAPAPYLPGQFVTLALPTKRETLYRSYSLCGAGSPDQPWELTIKRMERGAVSTYFYEEVEVGTLLYASLPRGAFTLPTNVGPEMTLIMIAMGSGITPIMGMLRALATLPSGSQPATQLHYASRSPEEIIFGDELYDLDPDQVWLWQRHYLSSDGNRMSVDAILSRAGARAAKAYWYVCGADALKRDLHKQLSRMKVPEAQIHSEIFATQSGPAYRVAQHAGTGQPGSLRIVETAAVLDVQPNETLLTALERHGYKPDFLTTVLFPQLFGGPTVTHSPNTLDQFNNGGDAYGQNGSQTQTPHTPVPPSSGALTPAQAPSSNAATTLHPVIITLDPSRHLNNGSQATGSVTRYLASDSVLEVGLANTSIDLTAATPSGNPIPTYTPAPKPTPAPTPKGPVTKPTPAATSAAASGSNSSALVHTSTALSPQSMSPQSMSPQSAAVPHASASSQASLAALAPHATGPFTLELTPSQVAFYSNHNGALLGGFTLRVLDGSRKELKGVKLTAPLTLRFHYQAGELAGLNTQDMRLVWTATGDEKAKKPAQSVPVSADIANTTLTASISSLVGGPIALAASSSDAGPETSQHLTMAGNSGDVQFTVPLQIPPAAGGLAPSLQLTYGSGGPNGRHGDNAPAPSAGDGWNLSLGSISYDQSYPGGGMYFLNGVGGISEPLLCCMTDARGVTFYVPRHHPSIRVQAGAPDPRSTGAGFYVWTGDGMQYDLGTSPNSRRSTAVGGVTTFVQWDLAKATRVADNGSSGGPGYLQQYTVTYWQDNYSQPGTGLPITRDAFLKEIDYNFGGGAPQARVLFNIHWPGATDTTGAATATTYGNNYQGCAPPAGIVTTLRCDDPVDHAGWSAAPLVFSTITLDRITPQLLSGGTWKTVRTYDLSYSDRPFCQGWDGFAGTWHACAGEHLLTQIQETPYQNSTAMPSRQPLVFGYSAPVRNDYFDLTINNWNGGIFNDQDWWQYLTSFTDKQTGASGTVAYKLANANTHGVPAGSNVLDPFACTTVNCWTGSTNPPEDRQWQRQTVASITDTGTGTTTNYAYTLKQTCGAGCTQDTWIPPNGWNSCGGVAQPPQSTMQACLLGGFSNYWMQEFAGFETVTTTHPDNSTTWQQYYGGAGWGTNDWDIANMYRDRTLVTDVYQGSPTGTPLQETRSTYLWGLDNPNSQTCPVVAPPNIQLHPTPYIFCFNHEIQRDTYFGGSSTSSPAVPKITQTWTYNQSAPELNHFHDELLSTTITTNDLSTDTYSPGAISGQPSFTTSYDYVYRDGWNETPTTGDYFINLPAQIRTKDNGSPTTYWRCGQTRYDGLGYATGANSSLKAGLPTQSDTFQACNSSGNGSNPLTTTQGYDAYGQSLVGLDADANAGDTTHKTCAVTGTDTLWLVAPTGAASFTNCTRYDGTYHAFTTGLANAKNQATGTAYDYLQGVATSSTDVNGQVTNTPAPVFEYNGSVSLANFQDLYSDTALPGETYGAPTPWTTRTFVFSFCANATTGGKPCLEADTVKQLDGTNLLVTRSFQDRDGRTVETRVSGPIVGQDAVTITGYNDQAHTKFDSQTCLVPSLTASNGGRTVSSTSGYIAPTQTASGSSAYVDPSVAGTNCSSGTLKGTTTYLDALNRTIATDDAIGTGAGTSGSGCLLPGGSLHHTTCMAISPVVASSTAGLPGADSQPYLRTLTVDANLHQSATYADARDKTTYVQRFTGASQNPAGSGIASYAVVSNTYDANENLRVVTDPAGNNLTYIYNNTANRLDSMVDSDRGTETYTYDANGNKLTTTDARGAGSSPVTLLGDTNIEGGQDFEEAGTMVAFKYTASASGSADQVSVYLDGANAATQVRVGLYNADGSGNPNTLLGQATLTSPTAGAWNSVSLSSVTLTAGQTYFIAMLSPADNGRLYYRDTAGGSGDDAPTSQATNLGALPSSFGAVNHWPQRGSGYVTHNGTSGGVIYAGYDGLNRQVWRNTTNTSSGAYVTYTYDATTAGNKGVGRLTNETFSNGLGSGSHSYVYDARGQVTRNTLNINGTQNWTTNATYDDAGNVLTQQYPTGETVTTSYNAAGAVIGMTTTAGPTTLLSNVTYNATNGRLVGASFNGGTYTFSETYDGLLRPSDLRTARTSGNVTMFDEALNYDNVGNVSIVNTTLSTGTDEQKFCYDEQDRLTRATSQGSLLPDIGCPTHFPNGSLTSALYDHSFAYDTLGRLTSGPAGAYTYGASAHKHAATAVGSNWTASYDASGDMTCRAPTSSQTCSGTPTGAKFTYDNEGHLTAWQDKQTSPTTTVQYQYDGEGNRIQQQVSSGGTTTITTYVGDVEQDAVTGGTTTKTTYYSALGKLIALAINDTTFSYLAVDFLNSVSVALDQSGNLTGAQLYAPYGSVRYSSGTMPTDKGFTGQRADSTTGLSYFNARYYDAIAGQFTSADTLLQGEGLNPWGLSRYAYVSGNPTTRTDPSGHKWLSDLGDDGRGPKQDPRKRTYWWWTFDLLGTDDCAPNGCFRDLKYGRAKKKDIYEIGDGEALAKYFGMHVDRVSAGILGASRADLELYIGQSFADPGVNMTLVSAKVAIEAYQPRADTPWDSGNWVVPKGIVASARDEGQQASIVVIDLSLKDPQQKLNGQDFTDYGSRIVFSPYSGTGSSQVARVIFVNGSPPKVVGDYDPLHYGPPPWDPSKPVYRKQ